MIPARPRLFALTAAVVVAAGITAYLGPGPVDELPRGFEAPVLALELVRTPADAAMIMDGDARRARLRWATYADFALIVAYTALWGTMARCIHPALGVAAIVAGVADLVENAAMLVALWPSAPTPPTQAVVDTIRWAAYTKWLLLGIVLMTLIFHLRPRGGVANGWDLLQLAAGCAYAYSGILCLIGVVAWPTVIERSMLPLSAALLAQLVLTVLGPATASGPPPTGARPAGKEGGVPP